MQLESVTVYALRIPFVESFKIALRSRSESDAVIVRVRDAAGNVGYGEGLPRPYVTGETVGSMVQFLKTHLAPSVLESDLVPGDEVFAFLGSQYPGWSQPVTTEIAMNAAFCAMELALLDWSLRVTGNSLARYLPPVRETVVYSGVISADRPERAGEIAKLFSMNGVRELKVKVGTPADVARLEAVREGSGADTVLRADANGAWSADEAVENLKLLERFDLTSIEQPVGSGDLEGLRRVRLETGIPVMVDESLVTLEQAERLVESGACDLFNIRLSKCGGITGSTAIAALARQAGIGIQVGAQVGETAILSAAGRHFAAHVGDLASVEGSYGRFLLKEDVSEEDLTFGQGGVAPLLEGPGLGVTVKPEVVERLAVEVVDLTAQRT